MAVDRLSLDLPTCPPSSSRIQLSAAAWLSRARNTWAKCHLRLDVLQCALPVKNGRRGARRLDECRGVPAGRQQEERRRWCPGRSRFACGSRRLKRAGWRGSGPDPQVLAARKAGPALASPPDRSCLQRRQDAKVGFHRLEILQVGSWSRSGTERPASLSPEVSRAARRLEVWPR